MSAKLHISSGLSLPLDFVTQTQAILAIKRVGKSYTGSVQAEELLKAGQQIVAIDVTGAWWGLRSNAAGDGPGFPVVIFGGDHGDVALEENAGEVLAEAIVTEKFSAIIDVSLLRKGQAQRFLAIFFETLYRRNRDAMHLFMDEADFYAPQKPFGEEARTLGAVNDIVRRGGIRGIGCTLITQRASVLNKDVLTQAGILTCLRVSHPRDMQAIREWVNVHSIPEEAQAMMVALPSLPIGTAYMWAPGWPTEKGIFERIDIRKRETFNSGATPKAGQAQKQPKVLAKLDIEKLGAQIQATVQRQKENDPAELKRQIAELKRAKQNSAPDEQVIVKAVNEALNKNNAQWNEMWSRAQKANRLLSERISGIVSASDDLAACIDNPKLFQPKPEAVKPRTFFLNETHELPRPKAATNGTGEKLPPGERAILIAAAQYEQGVYRDQLSVLTGYKRSSLDAYIQRLRERAYIVTEGDAIIPTDTGIKALGSSYEPLPQGHDLQQYWIGKLPEGERRILEVLLGHHGKPVSRDILDERTGYKRSSRDAYLQRLSARRLVEMCGRGEVKASANLF